MSFVSEDCVYTGRNRTNQLKLATEELFLITPCLRSSSFKQTAIFNCVGRGLPYRLMVDTALRLKSSECYAFGVTLKNRVLLLKNMIAGEEHL